MDTIRAQQQALDDELVAPVDHALKLTPLYNAFEISADVPEIYMEEFGVTVSRHHSSLHFKLNGKSHTINVDNFRDMLKICPKLPGQIFEEPPLEDEILSFIRDLGHTGEIKFLSDVNVNHMHQPWRSFAAIINKCLSRKTIDFESLRLSRAQILWGMYHNKTVDYVYLLWEDLVYQVENKNAAIPRRNKMFWHYARDDFMFTTIRVISKHQDTQVYGAILHQHLTNQAMLESDAYMTYHAYATGEKTPKPKSTKNKSNSESSPKTKLTQAFKGKRIKTIAKGDKPGKKKQSVTKLKGLIVLSEVALTEAEQIKIATKRNVIQTHSSHTSGLSADEGTGSIPEVPDVPTYKSDDEQIYWKSSEEEDDDEVNVSKDNDDDANNDADVDKDDEDDDANNQDDEIPDDANQDDNDEQTDSDNDGDDFVHPKLTTHDDEARQDDEVNEEEIDKESDDESNEDSNEEVQGANTKEEEMDEEATHEEDEANELYRDVDINLEGRDTMMTDAPLPNVQGTQVTEDTHLIITASINPEGQQQSSSVSSGFVSNMLNPSLDTCIDTIFTPKTEATSLVDIPVTTIAEPPLLSITTLPPTPLIIHLQQTPVPSPATVLSSSLQDLPNFGSLFGFDHRLKTLETDFSEFKQTNQFADAVSSIPGIVDAYLANKMHEAIKTDQVKEQVKAQLSKILPKIEKTVNKQLKAEVMTCSSTESKTFLTIATNLSELELKKILIDNMESNKSIHRSDEQKNLYKALVDAYETDKLILNTYGDTVSFKRRRTLHWIKLGVKEKTSWKRTKVNHLVELEYLFEEVYKETTEQLDWNNPEGQQYPHDLQKPLPLIPNSRGRRVIPFDHFINKDLEYLSGGVSIRKYATLVTKTKAADYGHIKWIEDLVPNRMWSQVPVSYDKHALRGISHWGRKRQQFYGFAANRESARDIYSKRRIIAVTKLEIVDWHNYKHLDWITVHRDDDKLYKFKEGDFNRLHIQDIEDMLLHLVQGKLTNLTVKERLAFNKLNLTKPDTYRPELKRRKDYTAYSNPRGFIYQNKDKKNRLMRIDELQKFSDGILNDVRTALNDRLKRIQMEYLP
ncbi:hypothetical protein Tco_0703298 [Tanacetum coccineum]|uniref:Uncharacterized protein n=1 Tax=Tanacetum coccineum TaxID=301880 RepID=A0ABQ4XZ95_9ASTR